MTTGELLVARVAMKPLATLNRPVLKTVDVETKEETVSFKERTDVTAVPAVGRRRGDDGRARARGRGAAQVRRRLAGRARAQPRRVPRVAATCSARRRHLVLVGLMGAGKTTVGRRCAERLGRPFVDTDDLVEAHSRHAGRRDLRATDGEARFRELERAGRRRRVRVAGAARDRVRRGRRARSRQPAAAPRRGIRGVAAGAAGGARRAGRRRRPTARSSLAAIARPRSSGSRRCAAAPTRRPPTSRSTPTAAPSTRSPRAVTRGVRRRGTGSRRARATRPTTSSSAPARSARSASLLGGRRRVAVVSQAGVADCRHARRPPRCTAPASTTELFLIGDGEDAKSLATVDDLCSRLRAVGPAARRRRRRARRRRRRRHRRLRRRRVPPRHRRRAGADHAARAGRRRDRRQDRR